MRTPRDTEPPTRRASFASHLASHLASRARLLAGVGLVATIAALWTPAPPPRTIEGVASLLGRSVGGSVDPADFVWEPRGGALRDAVAGRRVLFLARRGDDRDLYRARVRVTRAGRPMAIAGVHDLSRTPRGDERDLVARGSFVAFAMLGEGKVLGVRVLDLSGERDARDATTRAARLQAMLESALETGSTAGLRVVDVTFDTPPTKARFEIEGDSLVLALGDEGEPASVELTTAATNGGPRDPYGLHAHVVRRPVFPIARTMQALLGEVFGGRFAEAAEPAMLRARAWRRALSHAPEASSPSSPPLAEGTEGFPPSLSGSRGVGDAAFHAVALASPIGDAARPPALVEAVVHPDPDHASARVRLVAIDTRQLALRLVPGDGAPRPIAGPPAWRPPPHGAIAAFSGVSPAPRDPGAMVVEGRVLSPLVAGLPTLLLDPARGPRIGSWREAASPDAGSVRQAPAGLLPFGADRATSPTSALAVERSAVCVTPAGQLVYAYAPAASASTLARALEGVGCEAAMPLATSPGPVGFAVAREGGVFEPVDPSMTFPAGALARGSFDDVLYVVPRDERPRVGPEDATWSPDSGTQPEPAWSPAVHEATVVRLGAQVHLLSLAPDRFGFRVRAGADETVPRGEKSLPQKLDDADAGSALLALGLGTARRKGARGLAVDGAIGLPMRGDDAALVVIEPKRRALAIVPSDGRAIEPGTDATELPLTADDGKLRPSARALGGMRTRAALGLADDGTLVIASTTFDSDEATTQALIDAGVRTVVALDRGAHAASFVERAGTDAAVAATHDVTVLYVLGRRLSGRAAPLDR